MKTAQQHSEPATEADENATKSPDPEASQSLPVGQSADQKTEAPKVSLDTRKKRKSEEEPADAPESKKAKSLAQGQERKEKTTSTKRRQTVDNETDVSFETETPSGLYKSSTATTQPDKSPLDDESELSELVDDSPKSKSKKKRKDAKTDDTKAKAKTKPEKKAKAVKDKTHDDPDTEKIKSLQGWLLKCGIRKVWGTYLKPYETPKAKIRHLESMLIDVGMTGRFSLEKANQIKERREMAADLEAVQEGDKKWGKVDSEEDGGRPKRRLAKGFQALDFLGDDDGEETD